MAIRLQANVQPSASVAFELQANISGFTGDVSKCWIVAGVNNATVPVLFSDLTGPNTFPVLAQINVQYSRSAGKNALSCADDWSYGGAGPAPGDTLYVALVVSAVAPVGTDVLVAVSDPITVGP